jgi:ubiquinone/menaquinone biosynthesis C-methylase UbiE
MKMKKNTIVFVLILLAFSSKGLLLNAQSDLSEGWEVKVMEEMQPPKKIMDAIGVKPGMVIGEIGAGRGRFTVYLAREVGPTGKIYANDIDKDALASLKNRCKKLAFKQVETILGEPDDAKFTDQSLDLAFMVWVYHMIEKPDQLLKNLKKSLKPGALLVIVDPIDSEIDNEFKIDRKDPNNKIPTIKERVEKSAKASGFELVKVETFLPKDYIFILKQK